MTSVLIHVVAWCVWRFFAQSHWQQVWRHHESILAASLFMGTQDMNLQWTSYQIRKIAGCTCARNAGNVSPPPRVSDPDMQHGTCITHVPWCMLGQGSHKYLRKKFHDFSMTSPGQNPNFQTKKIPTFVFAAHVSICRINYRQTHTHTHTHTHRHDLIKANQLFSWFY